MKPTHTITITVPIDAGDMPELRARCRNSPRSVGGRIPVAVREAVTEAMYVGWPTERYGGDPATYREPRIGRISVRIEGPRDTYEGRP